MFGDTLYSTLKHTQAHTYTHAHTHSLKHNKAHTSTYMNSLFFFNTMLHVLISGHVVCCNVLQHVAMRCSVLQCAAMCNSVLQRDAVYWLTVKCNCCLCYSALQCLAVSCSVMHAIISGNIPLFLKNTHWNTSSDFVAVTIREIPNTHSTSSDFVAVTIWEIPNTHHNTVAIIHMHVHDVRICIYVLYICQAYSNVHTHTHML